MIKPPGRIDSSTKTTNKDSYGQVPTGGGPHSTHTTSMPILHEDLFGPQQCCLRLAGHAQPGHRKWLAVAERKPIYFCVFFLGGGIRTIARKTNDWNRKEPVDFYQSHETSGFAFWRVPFSPFTTLRGDQKDTQHFGAFLLVRGAPKARARRPRSAAVPAGSEAGRRARSPQHPTR